ncbi:hypothetical protein [Mesorhizobium sp. INR15]|uniref:hypothetical protein n=1 Tax=Mesorhizobium sp. INR15 TaxID=2654248 RepID=UPI0018969331|nr:hypothetical protein [Mesorhizobium sp. INR15]QPC93532.1 hypothetical protein GA829_24785 [Mesorhizobium sp. INR15]
MAHTDKPEPSGTTMLRVAGCGYVNALSASRLGLRGEEAYEIISEPETVIATKPRKKPASRPGNDDSVYDIAESARELSGVVDDQGDWTPQNIRAPRGAIHFRYGNDGPAISWRMDAQAARMASNRFSGQAANDNIDWPLAKLLKAEGNDHCLRLAERYRDVWNVANMPHDLVGRDLADNVYLMADVRLDESTGELTDKGPKKIMGKKARLDEPAKRSVVADPDKTKKRAKPIAKIWQGDWALIHHLDCARELSALQTSLGFLREGFEAAVVFGDTLEKIGRGHGVGNQAGAKGAGRALVMLGMQAVDELWQKPARNHAPRLVVVDRWQTGMPVPAGYYRSFMYPDAILKRAA